MEKLSAEQAYQIGIKLALHDLGFGDKVAQSSVPMPATAAGQGSVAAPMAAGAAGPMAAAGQAVSPQGMQPMQGAAPGSYENPQWQQQAMSPPAWTQNLRSNLRMPNG